jgi:hypothetical protein
MSDEFSERSAIFEFEAGMPREWAESFARLCTATPPAVFTPAQWAVVVNDGLMLWSRWKGRIRANGWTPADLKGLIPLIGGREVTRVDMGDITVGGEKIFRRPNPGGAAAWNAGRRAA